MTTRSLMDGMGHVKQTQLTTDPEGTDFTDFTYTGLGQISTKSNPYRGSPTSDKTTFTYDAMGRVKQVTQPDNSRRLTDFNGNCATVTDEAGNQRRSVGHLGGDLTQQRPDRQVGAEFSSSQFGRQRVGGPVRRLQRQRWHGRRL